jgi:hypothetical protein
MTAPTHVQATNANTSTGQVLQNMQQAGAMVQQAQAKAQAVETAAQKQSAAPASSPATAKPAPVASGATGGKAEQTLYTSMAAEACGVGALDDMMTLLTETRDPGASGLRHAQKLGLASDNAQTADEFFGFGSAKKKPGSLLNDQDPMGKIGLAGFSLTSQKDASVKTWGVQSEGITKARKEAQQAMTLAMNNEKEFGLARRELETRADLARQVGAPGMGLGGLSASRTDYLRQKKQQEEYGFKSPELTLAHGPKAPGKDILTDTNSGAA